MQLAYSHRLAAAAACKSLVACLPALEDAELRLLGSEDLGSLLEALAGCPCLTALNLHVVDEEDMDEEEADILYHGYVQCVSQPHAPDLHMVDDEDADISYHEYEQCLYRPHTGALSARHMQRRTCDEDGAQRFFPDATAFAKLQSLTKLTLSFYDETSQSWCPRGLSEILTALVPLTGLAELAVCLSEDAVVPAALAQLKGLRSLELSGLTRTVLEAGCLDLPNLASLGFRNCHLRPEVLPGVPAFAFPSLMRIKLTDCRGRSDVSVNYELVRLPRLQRMVFETGKPCRDACLWVSRLPADVGVLSSSLVRLSLAATSRSTFCLVRCSRWHSSL